MPNEVVCRRRRRRATVVVTLVLGATTLGADDSRPHPHGATRDMFPAQTSVAPPLSKDDVATLAAGGVVTKQSRDASGGFGCAVEDVAAPPSVVWSQLLSFETYPQKVPRVQICENYEVRDLTDDGNNGNNNNAKLFKNLAFNHHNDNDVVPAAASSSEQQPQQKEKRPAFLSGAFPPRDFGFHHQPSSSSYQSHNANGVAKEIKTRFVVGVCPGMAVEYFCRHLYEPRHKTLRWSLDYDRCSDLDDVHGLWRVTPHPTLKDWSRVEYAADLRLRRGVPGFVVDLLTKKALKDACAWVKAESERQHEKEMAALAKKRGAVSQQQQQGAFFHGLFADMLWDHDVWGDVRAAVAASSGLFGGGFGGPSTNAASASFKEAKHFAKSFLSRTYVGSLFTSASWSSSSSVAETAAASSSSNSNERETTTPTNKKLRHHVLLGRRRASHRHLDQALALGAPRTTRASIFPPLLLSSSWKTNKPRHNLVAAGR